MGANLNSKQVQNSLSIISNALAGGGVSLKLCGANQGVSSFEENPFDSANKAQVNIPNADFTDRANVEIAEGQAVHEALHCIYTYIPAMLDLVSDSLAQFRKGTFSSLEDAFVECMGEKRWKGIRKILNRRLVQYKRKGFFGDLQLIEGIELIERYIYFYCSVNRNRAPLQGELTTLESRLIEMLGFGYVDQLVEILEKGLQTTSSKENAVIANEVGDWLLNLMPNQPQQQQSGDKSDGDSSDSAEGDSQQQGSNSQPGDKSDGDNSDSTEGDSQQQGSNSQPGDKSDGDSSDSAQGNNQQQGSDSQSGDKSDGDSSDSAQGNNQQQGSDSQSGDKSDGDSSDSTEGDSQQQGSNSQPGDKSDGDSGDSAKVDNQQQGSDSQPNNSQTSQSNSQQGGKGGLTPEQVSALKKDAGRRRKSVAEELATKALEELEKTASDDVIKTCKNYEIRDSGERFEYHREMRTLQSALRRPLQAMLRAQTWKRESFGRRGELESSRLNRVITDGKAMRQEVINTGEKAAVALLLDASSSMKANIVRGDTLSLTRMEVAEITLGAMASTLENLNIPCEAWKYCGIAGSGSGIFSYKQFHEKNSKKLLGRLGRSPSGGTPTGEAMFTVIANMSKRTEAKRIIYVITDGDADDSSMAKKAYDMAQAVGIKVKFICIGLKWKSPFAQDDVAEIDSAKDLPKVMQRMSLKDL